MSLHIHHDEKADSGWEQENLMNVARHEFMITKDHSI